MTAAITPFAFLFMLPDGLENFGQSLLATATFSNNILIYITSGYWDIESKFKPLLHTWILGIEELFYLIFPFVLIHVYRTGYRKSVVFVGFMFVISLFYVSG